MAEWISVYFDPRRGGYHARWRTPAGDRKRKVPAAFLARHSVKPGERNERAARVAYRWAVEHAPLLKVEQLQREAERRTLRAIWDLFESRNPNNIAPITMTKYRERAAPLIQWFDTIEIITPDQIDRTAAAAYVRWREAKDEQGWRPASKTISNELAILKQLLEWAVEWRVDTGVAFTRFTKRPRLEQTETGGRALTLDELAAVLAAKGAGRRRYDVERAKRVIVVGVATMLRRSTLYGVRWEWIDATAQRIHVPGPVMKTRRGLNVPLAAAALEAMGTPQPQGPVFPNPITGTRTKHLQATIDALAAEAGVARFTPHDLRRTGYTLLAEHGVERTIRKVLMGHQTGIDVSDLYDRRMQRRLAAAVGVLDRLLREVLGREHVPADHPHLTGI